MFCVVAQIVEPVVGPDRSHQDCACVGLVVALPDGKLQLYAESADDLEAFGWRILAAVEELKRQPAPAAREAEHGH